MSQYPGNKDDNGSLPSVADNTTEFSGSDINALRDAILAIQNAIGVDPQGSTSDLVSRLSESLNDDGSLKASALLAAGLIALPITNAMISAGAAVEESKLDLDYATQTLFNSIQSNDVDIAQLQNAINSLLARFAAHISGADFNHDGYQIFLDNNSTLTPPSWLPGISATDVSNALRLMNERFVNHSAPSAIDSHSASSISVSDTNLSFSTSDAQDAIEKIDAIAVQSLNSHIDSMHANGFDNWANTQDGYNEFVSIYPNLVGTFAGMTTSSSTIMDIGVDAASFNIQPGDVLQVQDGYSNAGLYTIYAVGPRDAVGSKAALINTQVEVSGLFVDSAESVAGRIVGPASISNLKSTCASTIHFGKSVIVDSIRVSRPNAAKIISLGVNPTLVARQGDFTNGPIVTLRAGIGNNQYKEVSIDNLHYNRDGVAATKVTLQTIADRLNYAFQGIGGGFETNRIPLSAYVVGSEIMISHNWVGDGNYYVQLMSGTGANSEGNFLLGFDSFGADVVDSINRPSQTSRFYVNGNSYSDVKSIYSGSVDFTAGGLATFSSFDPVAAGVQVGHLLHLPLSSTPAKAGTYTITGVTSSTVTIDDNSIVGVEPGVAIEIVNDTVPLNDFSGEQDAIVETFIKPDGSLGYNERYNAGAVAGIKALRVSDNFAASTYKIITTLSGGDTLLRLGTSSSGTLIPSGFTGEVRVYSPANIEYVDFEITGAIGLTSDPHIDAIIYPHINEEQNLELSSIAIRGTVASDIRDTRLFGNVGLDEIREDVVEAYSESYTSELRSNGVIRGFDLVNANFDATTSNPLLPANSKSVIFRGGTAYINGVRNDIPTTEVTLPVVDDVYFITLDSLGKTHVLTDAEYSLTTYLDGENSHMPLYKATYTSPDIVSIVDLRYFINDIDSKFDLVVDTTNNRTGNFNTVEGALEYLSAYPDNEKIRVKIVSTNSDSITLDNYGNDVTFVLEGQVGDLTLLGGSSYKVVSSSGKAFGTANITGDVTLRHVDVEFENIIFGGDVTLTDNGLLGLIGTKTYSFDGCVFNNPSSTLNMVHSTTLPNLNINNCSFENDHGGIQDASAGFNGLVRISNSKFSASSEYVISINFVDAEISYCEFDKVGLANARTQDSIKFNVRNSIFKNFDMDTATGSSFIDFDCPVTFDGCRFESLSRSAAGGSLIDIQSTSPLSSVKDCSFDGVVISSGGSDEHLLKVNGRVDGCDFANITNAAGRAIACKDFSGNNLISYSGAGLVIGAETITNNKGFAGVEISSNLSYEPILIQSNVFETDATIAQSVFVYEKTKVLDNLFNINSAAHTALIVDDTADDNSSPSFEISRNTFDSGVNVSYGISFGTMNTSGSVDSTVIINNNSTNNSSAELVLLNANPINSLVMTNNAFKAASVQLGTKCLIEGNSFESLTISGTVVDRLTFNDNIVTDKSTGGVRINGPVTSSIFVGNDIEMILADTFDDSIISENTIGFFLDSGSVTFNNSIIESNNFSDIDYDGASNFPTFNSVIFADNILPTQEFTLYLAGSSTFISRNKFDGNVNILGSISELNMNENTTATPSTLSVDDCQNSHIKGNFGFGLVLGQMTNVNVTENVLSTQDIIFGSDISKARVDNNVANNIRLRSTSGAKTYDQLSISGNYVVGDIEIAEIFGNSSVTVSNSYFDNNFASNIYLLPNATISPSTASISKSSISNNVCTNLEFRNGGGNNAQFSLSDITMSDNKITNFTFNYDILFDNLKISNSTVETTFDMFIGAENIVITPDLTQFTGLSITNCSLSCDLNIKTQTSTESILNEFNISSNEIVGLIKIYSEENALSGHTKIQSSSILDNSVHKIWILGTDDFVTGGTKNSPRISLYDSSISGNAITSFRDGVSNPFAFGSSTVTDPVILYFNGSASGTADLFNVSIDNNYVVLADTLDNDANIPHTAIEILNVEPGIITSLDINTMSVKNNKYLNVLFVDIGPNKNTEITSLNVSGNIFKQTDNETGGYNDGIGFYNIGATINLEISSNFGSDIIADVDSIGVGLISNNIAINLDLSSLDSANDASRLIIDGNTGTLITLPNSTAMLGTDAGNVIKFNRYASWTSSGLVAGAATNNILFAIGNAYSTLGGNVTNITLPASSGNF